MADSSAVRSRPPLKGDNPVLTGARTGGILPATNLFAGWSIDEIQSWTHEQWRWFLMSVDLNPLRLDPGIDYNVILGTGGMMDSLVKVAHGGYSALSNFEKLCLDRMYSDLKSLSDPNDGEVVFISERPAGAHHSSLTSRQSLVAGPLTIESPRVYCPEHLPDNMEPEHLDLGEPIDSYQLGSIGFEKLQRRAILDAIMEAAFQE